MSFQAEHTLGRRILDGAESVRIFGETYKVRAQVESIGGYSAHADQAELLAWAGHFDRKRLQQTFVVHGEPDAAFTLAKKLEQQGHRQVTVPVRGQSVEFS